MTIQFFDLEWEDKNPADGTFVSSEKELCLLLDRLLKRPPFVIRLVGTNGYELGVGIGDPGFVQHLPSNGDPPCTVAVPQDAVSFDIGSGQNPYRVACEHDDEQEVIPPTFLAGGTPTPIPTRYCLSFETIKEIAIFFLKTGARSPAFRWDGI